MSMIRGNNTEATVHHLWAVSNQLVACQLMRDDLLATRVLALEDVIVDHCCDAWHKLIAQPWTIKAK